MTKPWPFPGDSPLDRAKRIAQSYRSMLYAADPDACEELDKRAQGLGEGWVVPSLITVDVDSWVTVNEAAELVGRDPFAVRRWIYRGRLEAVKKNGRVLVKVGDALDVSAQIRRARAARRADKSA